MAGVAAPLCLPPTVPREEFSLLSWPRPPAAGPAGLSGPRPAVTAVTAAGWPSCSSPMGARLSSDLLRLRLTSGWRLLGPAVSSELGVVARLWLVTVSEAAWPQQCVVTR